MIEVMEQQIVNNISGQYLKNKGLRRNLDIDKVSEALRVICSSRSSFYSIISRLRTDDNDISKEKLINQLRIGIENTYKWVTDDCIDEIIKSYEIPNAKDRNKIEEHIKQASIIRDELRLISEKVIDITLEKLLRFHCIEQ